MTYLSLLPTALAWWYGPGLTDLFEFVKAVIIQSKNLFSPGIILKTLFSPWKRDIGGKAPGWDGYKQWLEDNLVSRGVGFFVRLFMIIAFVCYIVVTLIFCLFAIVVWLSMPVIVASSFIFTFL